MDKIAILGNVALSSAQRADGHGRVLKRRGFVFDLARYYPSPCLRIARGSAPDARGERKLSATARSFSRAAAGVRNETRRQRALPTTNDAYRRDNLTARRNDK